MGDYLHERPMTITGQSLNYFSHTKVLEQELEKLREHVRQVEKKLQAKIEGLQGFMSMEECYYLVRALNEIQRNNLTNQGDWLFLMRHESLFHWLCAYQLVKSLDPELVEFDEGFLAFCFNLLYGERYKHREAKGIIDNVRGKI